MNMKTTMLAGCFAFSSMAAMAQARETTVTLGKEKINAVKVEVEAPVKQVQEALASQLAGTGAKPKRGAASSLVYNDVVLPSISTDTVDVWTRVQKNGNNSVIYMGVKNQSGNFLSGNADSASVDKLKDYLYDFARAQNYSSRDLEIASLMDSVRTDQSSFAQYSSERAKIETQIRELNNQLQSLEQRNSSTRQEMEKRRQRLEELRSNTGTESSNGNSKTGKTRTNGGTQ